MRKISALLLIAALSGCESKAPVVIEVEVNPYSGAPVIQMTSTANEVTIKKIEVNRGNCKFIALKTLPHTMRFGDTFKIGTPGCSKVIEVSLDTSDGSFDFDF